MSLSDDEYAFEELDSADLFALEAIEAAVAVSKPPQPSVSAATRDPNARVARLARLQQHLNAPPSPTSGSIKRSNSPSERYHAQPIMLDDENDPNRNFSPPPTTLLIDSRSNLPSEPPIRQGVQIPSAGPSRPAVPAIIDLSSDSFTIEDDFLLNDQVLQELDRATAAALSIPPSIATNKLTRQTTLTGEVIPTPKPSFSRTKSFNSGSNGNTVGLQQSARTGSGAKKTKTWDYHKVLKPRDTNVKGKAKEHTEEYDDDAEAVNMDIMPPAPTQLPLMTVKCDSNAAKEWIYPLNHPKRDYQFNIVRRALFENTLVSLPTGLGKTFVAGVVMLNCGKIVFLAPTKPLVAQQIEASHKTCGIPGTDAAELTGQIPAATRAQLWDTKRVFYLTPQTFTNDLMANPSLASRIVLVVFDEAHRATGNYAYCIAVRRLMITNPNFRVLALTATPGATKDAVQDIVDSMHISHIEIRDEGALDLREYIHKKTMVQHKVTMSPEFEAIRRAIIKLMESLYGPVGHLLPGANMATMHEYRPMKAQGELKQSDMWARGILSTLGQLARALGYLMTESLEMCYDQLQAAAGNGGKDVDEEIATTSKTKKKPTQASKKLANDKLYQDLMRLIEHQKRIARNGMMVHPKIDMLRVLLLQYFSEQKEARKRDEDAATTNGTVLPPYKESKVMVFASFRSAVEQIVEMLNEDTPIIRGHRFIGQAKSKDGGRKGLTQKEQLAVIERFKKGDFNTLVCTSIGEEGLDIGEVDYIVCYDSQKAPIKMLQRIGRTGRKKDGNISVLVSEGKEEDAFQKAKAAYAEVQRVIVKGDLELYSDVPRLLPLDIHPHVCEKFMPIVGYVKEVTGTSKRGAGALDGFMAVKPPKPKKEPTLTKKAKAALLADAERLIASDGDDRDLDEQLASQRRKAEKTRKEPAEASASVYESKKTKKSKGKLKEKSTTATKKRARDSSPDEEGPPAPRSKKHKSSSSSAATVLSSSASKSKKDGPSFRLPIHTTSGFITGRQLIEATRPRTPAFDISADEDAIPPLLDSDIDVPMASPMLLLPPASSIRRPSPIEPYQRSSSPDSLNIIPSRSNKSSYGRPASNLLGNNWPPDSSPFMPETSSFRPTRLSQSPHHAFSQKTSAPKQAVAQYSPDWVLGSSMRSAVASNHGSNVKDWLLDSDSDEAPIKNESEVRSTRPRHKVVQTAEQKVTHSAALSAHPAASPILGRTHPGKSHSFADRLVTIMGPPRVRSAAHLNIPIIDLDSSLDISSVQLKQKGKERADSASDDDESHEIDDSFAVLVKSAATPGSSQPIRRTGKLKRGRKSEPQGLLSSDEDREGNERYPLSPIYPLDSSPVLRRKHGKRPVYDRNNAFIAMEADLSGDDVEGGSTDTEGNEDEYDREFIADGNVTQASPGYDQSYVYRQSLLTQVPNANGPKFTKAPVRAGIFGPRFARIEPLRRRGQLSSSPPRMSSDDYSLDSFVVDDDDEGLV